MSTMDSSNLPPKVSHIAVHKQTVAQGTAKGYTQRPGELGSPVQASTQMQLQLSLLQASPKRQTG